MDKRYLYAALVFYLVPLAGISTDIYLPSLPSMVHVFSSTKPLVQVTITAYVLAMGVMQLFAGPISDAYGRRKPIILSLLIQITAILIIVTSATIYEVIVARFLQGIGAALMIVPARAILNDCFEGSHLKKQFNYLTIAFSIGPIIAPFIGGYAEHYIGWYASFWFVGICVFFGLLISFFFLKETIAEKRTFSVNHLWHNYTDILTSKALILHTLLAGLLFGYTSIFSVSGPFIFQLTLHLNAVQYGYIALMAGFFWFAGNITNRLLFEFSAYKKITFALSCSSLTTLAMLGFSLAGYLNIWVVAIPTYALIYFTGMIFPNIVGYCLSFFPKRAASVNAFFFSMGWIFFSAYTAIAMGLKAHTLLPIAISFILINGVSQWFFHRLLSKHWKT